MTWISHSNYKMILNLSFIIFNGQLYWLQKIRRQLKWRFGIFWFTQPCQLKVFQWKIYHQIISFQALFFLWYAIQTNWKNYGTRKKCFQVRYKNNNSCSSIPQSATPSVKKKVEDMRIREKYWDQILLISREVIKEEKRKSFRFTIWYTLQNHVMNQNLRDIKWSCVGEHEAGVYNLWCL